MDERPSDSPLVARVWRTNSEPVQSFMSTAASRWEIVFTRLRGETWVSLRGPETVASESPIPQDAEFFGIVFRHGAFMPDLPVSRLVDGAIHLPATHTGFQLHGGAWDTPTFDNCEAFVARLAQDGLLAFDPLVEAAVDGHDLDVSPRTLQRRFLRATGLTQRMVRQIERATTAVKLLDAGVPILEVVARAGYADQPHLTRALKRFIGETPGQIER